MIKKEKVQQIAEALSGLSEQDWRVVSSIIDRLYHPIKKSLTSKEISDFMIKDKFDVED
ncbi:hypothetical protein PT287_08255 [Lactobacillus sp. ESL0679]|uniref:hypothetical protein n=1 Tax=Lactobacillus sp. ESL0679 TaxID=2983209 RepID=UPI0023F75B14|nr:hypothetical protein [Lactobacillus sp. ESL0679]MDF7683489.1 hypothetical protein [Lactobacillus sp. ESL0679]